MALPPFFRGISGGRTNGKQGKCSHTCYFCIPGDCKNACWGASPNPVGCGPVLTCRALILGQNVPKQKRRGTAKTVPRQIGKCGKYLAISVQDI